MHGGPWWTNVERARLRSVVGRVRDWVPFEAQSLKFATTAQIVHLSKLGGVAQWAGSAVNHPAGPGDGVRVWGSCG